MNQPMSYVLAINRTSVAWMNRLIVWLHRLVGEFDHAPDGDRGNLPYGTKLHIEDGVGAFVVPRTKYDGPPM